MRLEVKTIEEIEEIEPATFQVVVRLVDDTTATLEMGSMTIRCLMAQIVSFTVA
jgi:hypothetical protein